MLQNERSCVRHSIKSGVVDSFCEKPDWSHASSDLANTGIYVLEPSILSMIPDNIQYDFAAHLFPEMMQEGKPSSEVYQHCGFGDYSNFYRAFKAEYQISPREFAAQLKQKEPISEEFGRRLREGMEK